MDELSKRSGKPTEHLVGLTKLKASPLRRQRPRVLICTPEITELPEGMGNAAHYIRAKGGGLGDISAGLIRYLHEDPRFELHVVLPRYDAKIRDLASVTNRELDLLGRLLNRHGIHLVTDSSFSSVTDVYGDDEMHPRLRRAEAFQRSIINDLMNRLRPDVVHCNDWMTGLVPAAARAQGIKSLFTLHNVFTEFAPPQEIDRSGIDVRSFLDNLYFRSFPERTAENWKKNAVDFTASGIHAADIVNTVSETFLHEIVAGDFPTVIPPSVRHAIREKHSSGRACGILNAPGDGDDPRISPHIEPYDIDDVMAKKRVNKESFQQRMGLRVDPDAPLFFWPSRLYGQKSPELLAAVARDCVDRLGAQIALVANGDERIERVFTTLSALSHGRISHQRFREDLSILGFAAADFVLMPSLYEPCGLPQMIGPRYGTLPVARLTGGLKDTVAELDATRRSGNGFTFTEHNSAALAAAMSRAVDFHRLAPEARQATIQRIMRESFQRHSLANTAKAYIAIYETLVGEH